MTRTVKFSNNVLKNLLYMKEKAGIKRGIMEENTINQKHCSLL